MPTWKLMLGAFAGVLAIGVVLWLAGMPRAAQIVGGLATLVIIMLSAFRKPPPRREKTGDASGINFGR